MAEKIDIGELNAAIEKARQLSGTLSTARATGKCDRHHAGEVCTEADAVTRKGAERLGWMQYRPEKMCSGCAAYWFAECAALTLENIRRGALLAAQ